MTIATIDPAAEIAAAQALEPRAGVEYLDAQIAAWTTRRVEIAAALAAPARGNFAERAGAREELVALEAGLGALLEGRAGMEDDARRAARRAAIAADDLAYHARRLAEAQSWFMTDDRTPGSPENIDLRRRPHQACSWLALDLRASAVALRAAGADVPAELVIRIPLE